jgi:hypothetical protein
MRPLSGSHTPNFATLVEEIALLVGTKTFFCSAKVTFPILLLRIQLYWQPNKQKSRQINVKLEDFLKQ